MREQGDRLSEGERLHVDLLGRAVPVVRTPDGLRAVNKGKPGNPTQVEKYLAGKFGEHLADARAAMAELAAVCEPADLYRRGFRLYEQFRPSVPAGESQLKRVADPYGVRVVSGGGFDSVTDKHGFAKLVANAAQPFDVLHIGDLDPAGESIFTVVAEDVPAFATALRGEVKFHRLAITEEQAKHLPQLPGAPRPIVQAEALPPDELAALVRAGIEERLDLKKMAAVERRTKRVRAATMKALQGAGLGQAS